MFANDKFLANEAAVCLFILFLIFPAVCRKAKYFLHLWKNIMLYNVGLIIVVLCPLTAGHNAPVAGGDAWM